MNSSNVNEVIRAVLNSLFFFFTKKILHEPRAPKAPKAPKAPETPKALKAQKAQNTTKQKHKKHKHANKRISDFLPCDVFKAQKVQLFYFCLVICVFVLLVRVKKRKLEKRERSPQCNVLNTNVPTTQLKY